MQGNPEEGGDDALGDGLDIDAVLGTAPLVVVLKDKRAVTNDQHTQQRRKSVCSVAVDLGQDGRVHRHSCWRSDVPASGRPVVTLQGSFLLMHISGMGNDASGISKL